MLMHCCVGPDQFYLNDDIFGVQVSNKRYTEQFIKQISLRQIGTVAIIMNDTPFALSTCLEANKYINYNYNDDGFELKLAGYYLVNSTNAFYDVSSQLIQDMNNSRYDDDTEQVFALLGCLSFNESVDLMRQVDDAEIPLKSIFLTVAPTKYQFVEELGNLTEWVLSVGQWHHAINYQEDPYFTNTQTYVELYENYMTGDSKEVQQVIQPTYTSAGASAALEFILYSIEHAFEGCDISATEGDINRLLYDRGAIDCSRVQFTSNALTGYERIRVVMMQEKVSTFFGDIRLNQNGRNDAMEPATIQIQYDKYGEELITQCVLPFNAANAGIRMPQPNRYIPGCPAGQQLPEDKFGECQLCKEGEYRCETCKSCQLCDFEEYSDTPGQAVCTRCPLHSQTRKQGANSSDDCACERGYFQDTRNDDSLVCLECPINGVCEGQNIPMYPEPGYWVAVENPIEIHQCSPQENCLGGMESLCKEGYDGKICEGCADGYYQIFGQCQNCPAKIVLIFQVTGIVIAWWIINTVMSRNMETFDVILSWVQLLSVVGAFEMNWPSSIYRILNLAALFAFEVDIIELSCLVPNWGFYHNFVVQLSMPIVVGVCAMLSYFVSYLVYHSHKQARQIIKSKVRSFTEHQITLVKHILETFYGLAKSILQLLFILPETREELYRARNYAIAVPLSFVSISYLTLSKYTFESFKCIDFNNENVMKGSIDISCDSEEYNRIQILGIIGLVLYIIPFPVLCFVVLRMLKNRKAFHIKTNLEQFGWLYNRYEVEWYWYELTQMAHRVLFVLVLVVLDSPSMESVIAMVVTIGLLMLHVYSRPYMDVVLDILHTFLQVALMLLILSGLIFYNNDIDYNERTILEYFILSTFGVFGVIFLGFLLKNVYDLSLFWYAGWRVKKVIGQMTLRMGDLDNVNELMHTFEVGFLRYWIRKANESDLGALHGLSNHLAEHVADESDTSYLSLTKAGRWWRYLSERFPEVIDFLAVTDEESRKNFIAFVEVLYRDYFKYKGRNNIFEMIRWEDRASVAQWLSVAPVDGRRAFNKVVSSMFLHARGKKIARDHTIRVFTSGRAQNSMKYKDSAKDHSEDRKPRLKYLWGRIAQEVSENKNKNNKGSQSSLTEAALKLDDSNRGSRSSISPQLPRFDKLVQMLIKKQREEGQQNGQVSESPPTQNQVIEVPNSDASPDNNNGDAPHTSISIQELDKDGNALPQNEDQPEILEKQKSVFEPVAIQDSTGLDKETRELLQNLQGQQRQFLDPLRRSSSGFNLYASQELLQAVKSSGPWEMKKQQ
eukprot:TRINITY_DN7603_c0_g1_i1.p1 TRINITY_DN7603_c0_g1~~TRINITY_DN7603_c0_g1_i1.p1  ORF type:complete len:1470 (-),score=133.53 TRINITY_DN7603_c0_g1_i1:1759-5634(-)